MKKISRQSAKKVSKNFLLAGHTIKPATRTRINIDMGSIFDFTPVNLPVEVLNGAKDGPTIFVCSTIHGDEIIGIEIVRRLLRIIDEKQLCGTLIAIPVVNVFGFNDRSRYLPDRRDLNRCFPGLKNGSLASQLAHKFMQEIVLKADYGIDIHTGAYNRTNLPQIRTDISNQENMRLAQAFNAPAIVNSNLRDGSLREATSQAKIPLILYEAGEALRFDEEAVRIGLDGILNVIDEIGMIKKSRKSSSQQIFIARSSSWIRASQSGICLTKTKLGDIVKKGQILAEISNPFGDNKVSIRSNQAGMIIGCSVLPLVNKGDALFHIGFEKNRDINRSLGDEFTKGVDRINNKAL
ncbi:MAG: hypothetical protein RL769_613 [Pseudomonadota bacterium]|jgi:predicted deacylase